VPAKSFENRSVFGEDKLFGSPCIVQSVCISMGGLQSE